MKYPHAYFVQFSAVYFSGRTITTFQYTVDKKQEQNIAAILLHIKTIQSISIFCKLWRAKDPGIRSNISLVLHWVPFDIFQNLLETNQVQIIKCANNFECTVLSEKTYICKFPNVWKNRKTFRHYMSRNYEDKFKYTFCEKGRHVWMNGLHTYATFYNKVWRPRPLKIVCSKPDSVEIAKILSHTFFWQKFRESNVFAKELISRIFFSVGENFSFFHTAVSMEHMLSGLRGCRDQKRKLCTHQENVKRK